MNRHQILKDNRPYLAEKSVDLETLSKMIQPHVVNDQMTYNDFEKIFGFLPRKEQYALAHTIEDVLNIELVDEIISQADEIISEDFNSIIFREANEIKISNKILVGLIQNGDEQARQDLCIKNLRLVKKFAARYKNILSTQLTFEDLVQEGTIGILKAAEKFDCNKEIEFSTYASYWIIQTITRAIVDTGLTIRLPVHIVEKILKASRLERDFLMKGFDLRRRIELIAQEMNITAEDVGNLFSLRAAYLNIISLDKPVDDEDNDSFLRDFIEDENISDPAQVVSAMILKNQLEKVLNTLKPREKKVLKLRYGLEDGKDRTLEEVGKIFHVTRERIRQIEATALRKLRHSAQAKKLKDFLD